MRLTAALLALWVGCNGEAPDEGGPPDAGGGEGEGEAGGETPPDVSLVAAGAPAEGPALPKPPFEPRITNWHCPDGWSPSPTFREGVASEHVPERLLAHTHCRPPDPPAGACIPGMIRRLGEARCVRQGVQCPREEEEWAPEDDLRARAPDFDGRVWYVGLFDRRGGGEGTRRRPFATITEALAQAAPGDIVALDAASYVEEVTPSGRVALLGRCVKETAIVAPGVEGQEIPRATVEVRDSGGSLISDLTITGPGAGMSVRGRDGDVTLRALRFERTALIALNVAEGPGVVTGEDLSFMDTQSLEDTWGRALLASREGKVRLVRPSLHNNRYAAFGADQPSAWLEAEDAIITGTKPHAVDGEGGYAFVVTAGARLKLRRAWLDGNTSADFAASSIGGIPGEPTTLSVDDLIVRNTASGALPFLGNAFHVGDGPHVTARRVMVEGTGAGLMYGSHRGTEVLMEDVVIRDRDGIRSAVTGTEVGAHAIYRRMIVAGVEGQWGEVAGPIFDFSPHDQGPPVATYEDLLVTRNTSIFGANAQKGAQLTIRRALLAGNVHHLAAVRAEAAGTHAVLEDVRIVDVGTKALSETDAAADAGDNVRDLHISGLGVWASHEATLTGRRVAIEDTFTFGLAVSANGSKAEFEDLLVRGVRAHPVHPERGGAAVLVQFTAALTAKRMHVHDADGFGVVVAQGPAPRAPSPTCISQAARSPRSA